MLDELVEVEELVRSLLLELVRSLEELVLDIDEVDELKSLLVDVLRPLVSELTEDELLDEESSGTSESGGIGSGFGGIVGSN